MVLEYIKKYFTFSFPVNIVIISNKTGNKKISILFPKSSAIPFAKCTGIICDKNTTPANANNTPVPQITHVNFLLPINFM